MNFNALLPAQLLLILWVIQPLLAFSETTETYQEQMSRNLQQLEALDKLILQSENQRSLLQQQLAESENLVSGREQRLHQLDKEIRQYEQRLQDFEQQTEKLAQSLDKDKQHLAEVLRGAQKTTTQTGLKIALGSADPTLSARLSVYTAHLLQAQQQRIAIYSDRLKQTDRASAEALKSRNWLRHIQQKARMQKTTYQQQAQQKRQGLRQLSESVEQSHNQVDALESEQLQLEQLLLELEKNKSNESGYFKSRKSKMPWPVVLPEQDSKVRLLAQYGDLKPSGRLSWDGLLIEADPGENVLAIAAGEVVYAEKLGGLGLIVVVDHSDNYLSLYGGNRKVAVKSGDWVETGATIATVGRSSGPNDTGVYLEIRHNAMPVDPEQWLASGNRVVIAKK